MFPNFWEWTVQFRITTQKLLHPNYIFLFIFIGRWVTLHLKYYFEWRIILVNHDSLHIKVVSSEVRRYTRGKNKLFHNDHVCVSQNGVGSYECSLFKKKDK